MPRTRQIGIEKRAQVKIRSIEFVESRGFANGPRDRGSIPGWVLDISLLNTQQYKVHIEGKVEQSRERSSALPLHLGVVAIEKGAFWSPSTTVANFTFISCNDKQKPVQMLIKKIWKTQSNIYCWE